MVIELRVVQFWSDIILVISNRTRAARSFDFEITRMISDQIALHSVQLPLLTLCMHKVKLCYIVLKLYSRLVKCFLKIPVSRLKTYTLIAQEDLSVTEMSFVSFGYIVMLVLFFILSFFLIF